MDSGGVVLVKKFFGLTRRITALGVTFALIASASLVSGCNARRELVIYNWGDFIAEDTITNFEKTEV